MTPHPVLYEINTWVWLAELSSRAGRPVRLESVPASEWDRLADFGFDAIWLMGVWERSPAGLAIAQANPEWQAAFRQALPDYQPADLVGSPYCVRRYSVDPRLGGPDGLAFARREMARRGLRLILDYVPNHVAPDHPWTAEAPDCFVQGNDDDLSGNPRSFLRVGPRVFALGRDPHFPPWPDVLQLNAFSRSLRQRAIRTLDEIGDQCDGVRCDMAMLMLHAVFERTWGDRAGPRPEVDFWRELIPEVRAGHPDFQFIAEAYWDLEWELQQQGFEFTYDKRLYDRLVHESAEAVRQHLEGDPAYQAKLVRFIENHDEPRAAATFGADRVRAVAVAVLTLPGLRLLHDGQLEGRRIRLPVFLGRRPDERPDPGLLEFHQTVLRIVRPVAGDGGQWAMGEIAGWPGDESHRNLVAWSWRSAKARQIVILNLSDQTSQGRVRIGWDDGIGRPWRLRDGLSAETYDRAGDDLCGAGLFVRLPAWGIHLWQAEPLDSPST